MFKKFVLIVATLLSLVISVGKVAFAESESWARILTDNVYLYSSSDAKQQVFMLEKSYYVSILNEEDNMYQVAVMPQNSTEFVQVIGWTRKSDLTLTDTAPIDPVYPTEKLTVTDASVDMKRSPVPSAETTCAILNLQQVCYYGAITSYGKTWYYVRYANRFGYIDANCVSEPNVPLHPTPLPQKPASTPPTTPPPDVTVEPAPDTGSPASEILLIVFVVVLAVGLTLALFLPGNIKKRNNVFEQDI